MLNQKHKRIAKEAGEAFSITASITSFLVATIGSFFRFPAFVSWVTGLGTGLIAACFGGARAWEEEEARERRERHVAVPLVRAPQTTAWMFTEMRVNHTIVTRNTTGFTERTASESSNDEHLNEEKEYEYSHEFPAALEVEPINQYKRR